MGGRRLRRCRAGSAGDGLRAVRPAQRHRDRHAAVGRTLDGHRVVVAFVAAAGVFHHPPPPLVGRAGRWPTAGGCCSTSTSAGVRDEVQTYNF